MSDILEFDRPIEWSAPLRVRLSAYVELTKPRIAGMVLAAAALGFYLALPGELSASAVIVLLHALLGTALVAGGANALNQWLEADQDRCMDRTRTRPLPSGRLTPSEVLAFSVTITLGGVAYLALFASGAAALVAGVAALLYAFVYTPMKRVAPACVLVGAVPGAMPPLIGWAAATGTLSAVSCVPFAILFMWQLPHFAAIAWLYREDYSRAGYPLAKTVNECKSSGARMIGETLGLIAVSVLPVWYGLAGGLYGAGAVLLGAVFLGFGIAFVLNRTKPMARLHLLASVVYLPLLFALMMIDKLPHS